MTCVRNPVLYIRGSLCLRRSAWDAHPLPLVPFWAWALCQRHISEAPVKPNCVTGRQGKWSVGEIHQSIDLLHNLKTMGEEVSPVSKDVSNCDVYVLLPLSHQKKRPNALLFRRHLGLGKSTPRTSLKSTQLKMIRREKFNCAVSVGRICEPFTVPGKFAGELST